MMSRLTSILVALVWLMSFGSITQAADTQLTIGACAPGCTGIVIAGGFATFVTKEVPGVSVSAPTSKGFVYNIRGMERGQFDFALGSTGVISRAVEGKKPFKKKFKNIRGMLPITTVPYHLVVLPNSGIKTIADMKGKRVNIGVKGGLLYRTSRVILGEAGIMKSVTSATLTSRAGATALTDGRVDVHIQSSPLPSPNIRRTAKVAGGIRLLPIVGNLASRSMKKLPGRSVMNIPAGLYEGVDKPVKTIGHSSIFAVRAGVSPNVVYNVVKTMLSDKGRKYFPKVHPAYKRVFKFSPGFSFYSTAKIKLHPGAVRYWKEKGVKIPADLM